MLGSVAIYLVKYYSDTSDPQYRAEQQLKELQKQYAEDPYGGNTPEETLRLFIEALKAGDTDLAAKYFILDKQEKWKRDLAVIKDKGLLDDTIKDLERLRKRYPLGNDNNRFIFEFDALKSDELTMQADISRGPNGKWKIIDI